MAYRFDYRIRPADKFFRTDNPDAHEVQMFGGDSMKRVVGVYATEQVAKAVAAGMNEHAGYQLG